MSSFSVDDYVNPETVKYEEVFLYSYHRYIYTLDKLDL